VVAVALDGGGGGRDRRLAWRPHRAGRHPTGHALGLALEPVARVADLDAPGGGRAVHGPLALLDDVGQLVGQGVAALGRLGLVVTLAEHDVVAHRVGVGLHRPGRRRRRTVAVDLDVAEVGANGRLHVGPDVGGQGAAGRADHVVDR
jgi:hypothetical protein